MHSAYTVPGMHTDIRIVQGYKYLHDTNIIYMYIRIYGYGILNTVHMFHFSKTVRSTPVQGDDCNW